MMTVLYGAYVSMTTPPDPLPPGVDTLLVESGMVELPDDFADFGIEDGTLEGTGGFAMASVDEMDPMNLGAAEGLPNPADSSLSFDSLDDDYAAMGSTDASATDPAGLASPANSFSMSDRDSGTPRPMGRLPEVEGTAIGTTILPEPGRDYPTTGAAFAMPDPAEAVTQAEPTRQNSSPVSMDFSDASDSTFGPGSPGGTPAMPAGNVPAAGLANAIATADRQFQSDRRREALATLSLFYETPNLTVEQREQLLVRLDPLARDVIYSPEHLLEEPHRVGPNETLMDIAQKYDVPWQLLANINGVSDPVTVLPGTDLKVVRGPFRADVDLVNKELTLFLGDLYAGRFPIGVGSDPIPREGTYTIQEKKSAKTYYDMAGTPIPPGNPRNPYGAMWIDLGQGISLHGSPQPNDTTDEGCISIAGNYSRDVFGILSEGSTVTIR